MSQLISKIFLQKTVLVLRIQGTINSELVNLLTYQLDKTKKGSIVALALVINSDGGCSYQVESLKNKIQRYATTFPLYTFVTDKATGNALELLNLGSTKYCQQSSKIGFGSLNMNKLKFHDFAKDLGIQCFTQYSNNTIPSYKHIINSIMNKSNDNEIEIIQDHLNKKEKILNKEIKNIQGIQEQLFIGNEAKKVGLIDKIGTYEQVLMELFPKAQLNPIHSQSKLREYENWFNLFIKVSQSRGFLGLVLLFGLKVAIKWIVIIYVWRQTRKQKKIQKQQQNEIQN